MHQWDEVFKKQGKFFLESQEDIPRILKLFKKKGVKKVLDLGSGSGRHVVYFAKHGFQVYGIDISPQGVKLTREWLRREGLGARLRVGDIYRKLPYPNVFFDALISIQTMHHNKIENIRKLIKEMKRVLKPGAFIFITVSKKKPKAEIPKEKMWKIKFIAPRTFVPLSHDEKGLIHYWFNKAILRKEFKGFKIDDIWAEKQGGHYCLLAKRL